MSEQNPGPGRIVWTDLTVDNAEEIRDFYGKVVGWSHTAVDMGGYSDFNMTVPGGHEMTAGICHKRGSNSDLPSQWLVYVTVEDVEASARTTADQGGKVLVPPKRMAEHGSYCVIQDPAGAVVALFQPAPAKS